MCTVVLQSCRSKYDFLSRIHHLEPSELDGVSEIGRFPSVPACSQVMDETRSIGGVEEDGKVPASGGKPGYLAWITQVVVVVCSKIGPRHGGWVWGASVWQLWVLVQGCGILSTLIYC